MIELMIGMALMAILITLAVPNFALWIRNLGIRGAAESILSGLQLTRAEALKRNTTMHFQLTDTLDDGCVLDSAGPHWIVSRDSAAGECGAALSDEDFPHLVRTHDGKQAGGNKTIIAADASLFTFNGLGRLTTPAASKTVINVYGADGADDCVPPTGGKETRCLRVEINSGGNIRMCDPALSGDAQACGGTN